MRQANTSVQRAQDAERDWTKLPNALLDAGLTPVEFQTTVLLLSYRWGEREPFPSVPTLARRLGVSHRTVQRRLRALERKRVIITEARRRNDGGRTSNRYHLAPFLLRLASPPNARPVTRPRQGASLPPVTWMARLESDVPRKSYERKNPDSARIAHPFYGRAAVHLPGGDGATP